MPPTHSSTSGEFMHEVHLALSYDKSAHALRANMAFQLMTGEQKMVYVTVLAAVNRAANAAPVNNKNAFFLEAPGGTGKTFTVNAIIDRMRSAGKIVIPVASSGLAALLLPDGRTAHSRFKIPIAVTAHSQCFINKGKDATLELVKRTALIVWDEAPMQQRFVIEAVDRTLRDLLDCDEVFGGIPVLFCGDFQQILPVVPRASKHQIIARALKSSKLWKDIKHMTLNRNMRVHLRLGSASEVKDAKEFNEVLLRIGHGKEPVYLGRGADVIKIPEMFVSVSQDLIEFIGEIYPALSDNIGNKKYLCARAILTSKNATVDMINALMLDMIPGETPNPYLSADSLSEEDDPLSFPVELLNSITPSGLPAHELNMEFWKSGISEKWNS